MRCGRSTVAGTTPSRDYRRAILLAEAGTGSHARRPDPTGAAGVLLRSGGRRRERSQRYLAEALAAGPEMLYVQYFVGVAAADRSDRADCAAGRRRTRPHGIAASRCCVPRPSSAVCCRTPEYRKIIGVRLSGDHGTPTTRRREEVTMAKTKGVVEVGHEEGHVGIHFEQAGCSTSASMEDGEVVIDESFGNRVLESRRQEGGVDDHGRIRVQARLQPDSVCRPGRHDCLALRSIRMPVNGNSTGWLDVFKGDPGEPGVVQVRCLGATGRAPHELVGYVDPMIIVGRG